MEFKEGKCPKCGGILQVPQDLEKLTCMYCGREISARDMIVEKHGNDDDFKEKEEKILNLWSAKNQDAIAKALDLLEEDRFNHTANYILALNYLPGLITEHKNLIDQFKKNLYENAMKEYMEFSRTILVYLERACSTKKQDRSFILTECASYFISKIKEDMALETDKKLKKAAFVNDDYKMILVLFTIPMILELNLDISDEFADKIIEAWIKEYPKSLIKKGTFESINNGFRKKGFCYITTAVCETLGKSEDCYELMMFRNFRDDFLLSQEDGEELIREYYRMAPMIVNSINDRKDRNQIYNEIWHNYLKGCLTAIESGDNAKCKTEYSKMVINLKKQYC
ncbi:DNA-directed RNA polymerase subunit M/transcription elongation factor TFIIS [Mobilisporobacter senegalensis]|uniref:DNA-directed RNA polymerase subunit M/transcription elongation factor TFIIS n=1 Tax=Mobilisporobacter senegalensis TaxID=1329262 RepID=A0A3N1XLV2_9FIRM|nr:CFI-box-CTERM domain-containing protein [Mobilisporobacter senegalensis]ROR27111.1 DNA-directed RNA polymerase subunit M/transcription elongation factor TFIIS [Mobilisporobacter senegalensis]